MRVCVKSFHPVSPLTSASLWLCLVQIVYINWYCTTTPLFSLGCSPCSSCVPNNVPRVLEKMRFSVVLLCLLIWRCLPLRVLTFCLLILIRMYPNNSVTNKLNKTFYHSLWLYSNRNRYSNVIKYIFRGRRLIDRGSGS